MRGAAKPSSKKDFGRAAVCVGPTGVVKDVTDAVMSFAEADMLAWDAKRSIRDRGAAETPLIESIDVAGEIPSEIRFRG